MIIGHLPTGLPASRLRAPLPPCHSHTSVTFAGILFQKRRVSHPSVVWRPRLLIIILFLICCTCHFTPSDHACKRNRAARRGDGLGTFFFSFIPAPTAQGLDPSHPLPACQLIVSGLFAGKGCHYAALRPPDALCARSLPLNAYSPYIRHGE